MSIFCFISSAEIHNKKNIVNLSFCKGRQKMPTVSAIWRGTPQQTAGHKAERFHERREGEGSSKFI
jgi:hypothetical protein